MAWNALGKGHINQVLMHKQLFLLLQKAFRICILITYNETVEYAQYHLNNNIEANLIK